MVLKRWPRFATRLTPVFADGLPTALPATLALMLLAGQVYGQASDDRPPLRQIGATAVVTEASTGLPFRARVDTGATTCSIHCEVMEIEDASENAAENIGKPIRFLVKNKSGDAEWLKAVIADHVIVKTSERADGRYKVKLGLRWEDVEKTVLVTLNNRKHMTYPVLIGRNFLRNDFLVNVALDGLDAIPSTADDVVVPASNALAMNEAPPESSPAP